MLYESDIVLAKPDYQAAVEAAVNVRAPFMTLMPSLPTPSQMLTSWSAAAYGTHFNPKGREGRDKTSGFGKYVPPTLKAMAEQLESTGWMVTDLAELTAKNSAADVDAASQQAKDAENFLISIEKLLLSDQEQQSQDLANDKDWLMRTLFRWLYNTAQAVEPVPEILRPATRYTGKLAEFTEDTLKAAIKACHEQVDQDVDLTGFVGIDLKAKMSEFTRLIPVTSTQAATRSLQATLKDKLREKVDFFEYDGGMVKTVTVPRLGCDMANAGAKTAYTTRSGAFIDVGMWGIGWMKRIYHKPLVDAGGGPRGYHKAIARLICKNPQGQFAAWIGE